MGEQGFTLKIWRRRLWLAGAENQRPARLAVGLFSRPRRTTHVFTPMSSLNASFLALQHRPDPWFQACAVARPLSTRCISRLREKSVTRARAWEPEGMSRLGLLGGSVLVDPCKTAEHLELRLERRKRHRWRRVLFSHWCTQRGQGSSRIIPDCAGCNCSVPESGVSLGQSGGNIGPTRFVALRLSGPRYRSCTS